MSRNQFLSMFGPLSNNYLEVSKVPKNDKTVELIGQYGVIYSNAFRVSENSITSKDYDKWANELNETCEALRNILA